MKESYPRLSERRAGRRGCKDGRRKRYEKWTRSDARKEAGVRGCRSRGGPPPRTTLDLSVSRDGPGPMDRPRKSRGKPAIGCATWSGKVKLLIPPDLLRIHIALSKSEQYIYNKTTNRGQRRTINTDRKSKEITICIRGARL